MASFDGSNKGSVSHGQNIAYHTFTSPEYEALKARVMARATQEAIAFLDPLRYTGPCVVCDASAMSPEQWQAARRNSIGSSAAGQVFGDSPYPGCTNLDLYHEKVGSTSLPFSSSDKNVRDRNFLWGHLMEEYLQCITRQRFPRGQLVIDTNIYADPVRPFLTANLDGMLRLSTGEYVHIEYKTSSTHNRAAYEQGIIPPHYKRQLIQCQHILGVWKSFLIVGFGRDDKDIFILPYERDLDAEMAQVKGEEVFWNEHVLKRIPPDPLGPPSNIIDCVRRYAGPADEAMPSVAFSPAGLLAIKKAESIGEKIASLEKEAKALKELREKALIPVYQELGAATQGSATDGVNTYNVTWRQRADSRSCDYDGLILNHPDIAAEFIKTNGGGTRVFKIKKTET